MLKPTPLKLHECGCMSRGCSCNHHNNGQGQWCTQYICQYCSIKRHWKGKKRLSDMRKIKKKVEEKPLIEQQREAQREVMKGLKQKWAMEAAINQELDDTYYHCSKTTMSQPQHRSQLHTEFSENCSNNNSISCNFQCCQNIQIYPNDVSANSFCRPPEYLPLSPRPKLDSFPGGNEDYRLQSWLRLEQSQPEHRKLQCEKHQHRRHQQQLEQIYLKQLQEYQYKQQIKQQKLRNYGSQQYRFHNCPHQNMATVCNHQHHQQQQFHPQYQNQNNIMSQNMNPYLNQQLQHQQYLQQQQQQQQYQPQNPHLLQFQQQQQQKISGGPPVQNIQMRGLQYCMIPQNQTSDGRDYGGEESMIGEGDCISEIPNNNKCPSRLPGDIMEPRHYLVSSDNWRGVAKPFSDPRFEVMLPSSHDTFSLIPSASPFAYIGKKTNWTNPSNQKYDQTRFSKSIPVTALRPEVFGHGLGVAVTTNLLGYRPQRRHFKERASMVVYN